MRLACCLRSGAANGSSRVTRRVSSLSSILSVLASAMTAATSGDVESEGEAEEQPLRFSPDDIAKLDTCSYGPHRCRLSHATTNMHLLVLCFPYSCSI